MKFNNPTLINYVRVAKGGMVDIGALEEQDFDKWMKQYSKALKKHWKFKRDRIKEKQTT
jgi:hypothetical protein